MLSHVVLLDHSMIILWMYYNVIYRENVCSSCIKTLIWPSFGIIAQIQLMFKQELLDNRKSWNGCIDMLILCKLVPFSSPGMNISQNVLPSCPWQSSSLAWVLFFHVFFIFTSDCSRPVVNSFVFNYFCMLTFLCSTLLKATAFMTWCDVTLCCSDHAYTMSFSSLWIWFDWYWFRHA